MSDSTDSNALYSIVSKADADFAIIWDTQAEGETPHIVHSGIINSDGSYTSNSGIVSNQTESQFNGRNTQPPGCGLCLIHRILQAKLKILFSNGCFRYENDRNAFGFNKGLKIMTMKKIFFLFILINAFYFHLLAQTTSRAGLDVNVYNPSANQFFDQHKNIDHIVIFYDKRDIETIEIFFRGKPQPIFGERYTLTFDGDLYFFRKKYEKFPLPNATTAKLTNFQGIGKITDVNVIYDLTTTIRRDSLVYHFNFYTYDGNTAPRLGPADYRPTFKGDILKLTKKLEEDFKKWKPIAITDSMILLTGLVEKDGTIGKLKLIEGKPSVYSNKVLEFMGREATSWLPRVDGSGKRAWKVRISVRINKDNSMKVSIL